MNDIIRNNTFADQISKTKIRKVTEVKVKIKN